MVFKEKPTKFLSFFLLHMNFFFLYLFFFFSFRRRLTIIIAHEVIGQTSERKPILISHFLKLQMFFHIVAKCEANWWWSGRDLSHFQDEYKSSKMNFLLIIFSISIKRFRFFVFTFRVFLISSFYSSLKFLLIFTFHSNAAFNRKSFLSCLIRNQI